MIDCFFGHFGMQCHQAGVREYWIVDPDKKLVNISLLENGFYKTTTCDAALTPEVAISVLPGCVINLTAVFADL